MPMENMKPRNGFYCTKSEDIPKEEHWAIIKSDSFMQAGWGPNDPSTSEPKLSYIAYRDKDEWEKEIQDLAGRIPERYSTPTPYIAVYVAPAKITTKISISVDVTIDKH